MTPPDLRCHRNQSEIGTKPAREVHPYHVEAEFQLPDATDVMVAARALRRRAATSAPKKTPFIA
jgi:hypothetical protein